jgi:phage-related minor tail protein
MSYMLTVELRSQSKKIYDHLGPMDGVPILSTVTHAIRIVVCAVFAALGLLGFAATTLGGFGQSLLNFKATLWEHNDHLLGTFFENSGRMVASAFYAIPIIGNIPWWYKGISEVPWLGR